jgi:hypothetical protein
MAAPPAVSAAPVTTGAPVTRGADGMPTAPFRLTGKGGVPDGCFAWSPRNNAAACAIGIVGSNLPGGGTYHTEWRVELLGDAAAPAVDLTGGAPKDEAFSATEPLAASVRAQLEAALAAGGYVELAPLHQVLQAGKPLAWAEGAEILWTRKRTFPGGENQAPRYTDTLSVRWAAGGAPTTIETREDAPVGSPEYAAYLIPGGRFAVLSDDAGYGDEGVSGSIVTSFRCDRVARRCK